MAEVQEKFSCVGFAFDEIKIRILSPDRIRIFSGQLLKMPKYAYSLGITVLLDNQGIYNPLQKERKVGFYLNGF